MEQLDMLGNIGITDVKQGTASAASVEEGLGVVLSFGEGPALLEKELDRQSAEADSEDEATAGSWVSFLGEKDIAALATASWLTLPTAALHFWHVADFWHMEDAPSEAGYSTNRAWGMQGREVAALAYDDLSRSAVSLMPDG